MNFPTLEQIDKNEKRRRFTASARRNGPQVQRHIVVKGRGTETLGSYPSSRFEGVMAPAIAGRVPLRPQ